MKLVETKVEDFMDTIILLCEAERPIDTLELEMRVREIECAFVADAENTVLGVVAERELQQARLLRDVLGDEEGRQLTVRQSMNSNYVTIESDEMVDQAAALFFETHCDVLLVTKNSRIMGFLTPIDIFYRALYRN